MKIALHLFLSMQQFFYLSVIFQVQTVTIVPGLTFDNLSRLILQNFTRSAKYYGVDGIDIVFNQYNVKSIKYHRIIPCQITRWSHEWHLTLYWKLDHSMRSWRKYYPEKFSSILHMVQKLLLFEFCPKFAKIGFCQMQARFFQLWSRGSGWLFGELWNMY